MKAELRHIQAAAHHTFWHHDAMTAHAFIAGATGYTGRALVGTLADQGIKTTAHVRPDSSALDAHRAYFEGFGAHVDTTPWTEDAMRESLLRLQPTLVFCLLGTTRHRVKQERQAGGAGLTYDAVDYGMTMMVIRAAEAMTTPPRVVYLSSAGVKPSRPGSYLEARYKVESALKASALAWTIARPCFITGSDRQESRPAERFGAIVSDSLLTLLGPSIKARFSSITAGELSRGLLRHAMHPESAGATIDAAGLRDL